MRSEWNLLFHIKKNDKHQKSYSYMYQHQFLSWAHYIHIELVLFCFHVVTLFVCVFVYQVWEVTWSRFRPVESPPICTWTVYPWGIPTPPPGSAPHRAPPSLAPVSFGVAVECSTVPLFVLSYENKSLHDGLSSTSVLKEHSLSFSQFQNKIITPHNEVNIWLV